MTQQYPEPLNYPAPTPQPEQAFTPPPAPKPKRKIPAAAWAVPSVIAALLIGALVGNASGSATAQAADAAKPVPTVTQTQTKSVNVPVTPSTCIQALVKAEAVMDDYHNAIKTVVPAMNALQAGSSVGLNQATAELQRITPILQSDLTAYELASSSCKVGTS